jgi:hypothetical protein
MAEDVACPECGEEVDPRGLSSHMTHKHPDREVEAPVSAEPSVPKEVEESAPIREENGAVVFRDEIRVTDPEAKRELVAALKDRIRGNSAAGSDEITL